ncbi:MAG: GyrI-like domain-containing protein [Rhodospirillum sp.]|nr:GyrI-like domain-containing protein [Rhodospirillum sp.]MCF8490079.1 GyrI-like domain-containing protein [Rhodospirillum sp.]MCF8500438.1 GyrI-like domain-containing protein [Rhodospirillum sp.]
MEIKQTADMWVVSLERWLRIPDIGAAGLDCGALIEERVAKDGLTASGPWIFVSHDLPKDGETLFRWEICRPVHRPSETAVVDGAARPLPPIRVATRTHRGPLSSLFPDCYGPLVQEIVASGLGFSGESREVYHVWKGSEDPGNEVEIQFGLAT